MFQQLTTLLIFSQSRYQQQGIEKIKRYRMLRDKLVSDVQVLLTNGSIAMNFYLC